MFPPPAPNFYQVQLTILALFCFTSIALERWVDYTKKKGADLVDERERRPLLQDAAGSAFTSLRRNYLLVYGAVMSEYDETKGYCRLLTPPISGGLAAGAVRLFAIQGAVRFLGARCRPTLRDRLHGCWPFFPIRWRLGR